MKKKLTDLFMGLRDGSISFNDYQRLHKQCFRLVKKACRRYAMDSILDSQCMKEEVQLDIVASSLIKSLNKYDPSRGAFSTFYYYKALSMARVEAGRAYRRSLINNTTEYVEQKEFDNEQ